MNKVLKELIYFQTDFKRQYFLFLRKRNGLKKLYS